MDTKKVLTANLKPGMVSSEAAYTYSNHLVIQSNTALTPDIIDKLKYYAVKSIKIYMAEDGPYIATQDSPDNSPETNEIEDGAIGSTYFERIQESDEYKEFKKIFTASVEKFKREINDLILKNTTDVISDMLEEVNTILSKTRNPLHLLDMMQCLRGYDDMTYMHSMNVALICHIIGSWIDLSPSDIDILVTCGLLHDIGKLKIPVRIIAKPGKLTDEEFERVRSHPQLGYEILDSKELDERIKLTALQHHEWINGTGYPNHLTAPEIHQFSSIVAIADVYDAMTSNRAYRKGICPFTVISTFEKEQELYDPGLLYLFMKRTIEAYINTEVLLSNGEQGKVVMLNQNHLSRPVVVTESNTYDLSRDFTIDITTLI